MTAPVRSALSAGLAAGLVVAAAGAVLSTPVPAAQVPALASPAVELSALVSANVAGPTASPGDVIINAYFAVQPWVQYGFEVGAWAFSWLPWPIGLLGPQVNIAYSVVQPLSEAVVFSLAFLVDGQFDLVGPTLAAGFQTAVDNFVTGEINWIASFLPPLPPLPFPVFPGAAVASADGAPAGRRAAAARPAAPATPLAPEATVTPPDAEAPVSPAPPTGPAAIPDTAVPVEAEVPDTAVAVDGSPRRAAARAAIRADRSAAALPTAAVAVPDAAISPAAARRGATQAPATDTTRTARQAR